MAKDPECIQPLNPDKFRIVRTDGSSNPGGRHENCTYFVLDLKHDVFAKNALSAYADACADSYPLLAEDIRKIINTLESP